jgi:2-(1,2-epoxy-1,2-dihydrophenyl)acetyl-CoA isomerase
MQMDLSPKYSRSVTSPEVAFAVDGAIASITLNRPESGNSINLEMAQLLAQAAADCDSDERIRSVVLTGAGRMFCVGGDVKLFGASAWRLPHVDTQLTDNVHAACTVLAKLQKPLIVLVSGPAAGAGFGLSMPGDIVIAARSAHFTVGYGTLGLTPGRRGCCRGWLESERLRSGSSRIAALQLRKLLMQA